MSDGTWKNTGNDLIGPSGGKVTGMTAGTATGHAVEYDQVRTMVATGGTANRLLRASGTGGHTTQNSALGCTDGGILTGATAGAQGATTTTSSLGSASGSAVDQDIAAASSDFTADLPIAASTTVDVRVQIVIVDSGDSDKKRRIRGRLLVERGPSGSPAIIGGPFGDSPDEWLHTDDATSIYVADDPVTLYGAPSISGNNLRITIADHATHAQIASVDFYTTVTAIPS